MQGELKSDSLHHCWPAAIVAIHSETPRLLHNEDHHPLRQDRLFAAQPAVDRWGRAGS